MEKKKVFLAEYIHPSARALLEQYVEIIDSKEDLSEVVAAINRNQVKIRKEFIDKAPNLKIIGVHGTGLDGVDVAYAKEKGIEVFNTPGANAASVAELNIALALDLSRNITRVDRDLQKGIDMLQAKSKFTGHEIGGKTAGFLGFGNIGRMTAQKLQSAFGCKILAWDKFRNEEEAAKMNAVYVDSVENILKESDLIFMALSLDDSTRHMIDYERLCLCKPSTIFINAARGPLVDEEGLQRALEEGRIYAAASDVFEKEPVSPEHPLLQMNNFFATPHIGGNTEEALQRVGMAVVEGTLKRLGYI